MRRLFGPPALATIVFAVLLNSASAVFDDRETGRVLTTADNGREVSVREGDSLRFRLPTDSRNGWSWAKLDEEKVLGKHRNKYERTPGSELSSVLAHYEVKSTPENSTRVRWIYCRFGRPVDHATKSPLEPGRKIKAGEAPEQGMIYELKLVPAR